MARASHHKPGQAAPIAKPADLVGYDAVILGTGTRYGRMTSQMADFWDQAGGLWAQGKLIGKVGAAFTSTPASMAGRRRRSWASTPPCRTTA